MNNCTFYVNLGDAKVVIGQESAYDLDAFNSD